MVTKGVIDMNDKKTNRRVATIAAKVTLDEHRRWCSMAESEGSSISTKIRMLLTAAYGRPSTKEPVVTQEQGG